MHASTLHSVLEHLRKLTDPARARELSDANLLERFRLRREEAAFTLLVQRHGPMVLAVCRRILGDAHEAEDVFQATFLVLVRKAATIRKRQSLSSWLHGVASRIAQKARLRSLRQRMQESNALPPSGGDDPSEALAARELRAALDAEIERLPAKYRMPLVLCYLADKTHEQAAQELGWPKSSVTARLAKARKLLQRRLRSRGFTAPAGLLAVLLTEQTASATVPSLLTLSTVRLAVQALTGEALTATTAAALAGSFVKGAAVGKWTAVLMLLATLGFAAVAGSRLAVPGSPTKHDEPPPKTQAAGDPRSPKAEPRKPRVDLFGDPLPPGALARMGTLRFRHWAPLHSAAYSPDGKLLATAGTVDRQVRLWEATTGRLLAAVPGSGTVVFTHDGQRLFYCGGNINAERKLLNIAGLREEESPIFAVNSKCMALSPDGQCLALDMWNDQPPHEVRVCDVTTGKVRLRLTDHQKPVSCLAYSPDGKTIATAGDEAVIRLWDAATGKLLLRLDGHRPVDGYRDHMLAVTFSPDGKQLVSGGMDQTVRLWDVAAGKEVRRFGEHKGGVLCVAFTPDGGQVLTGGFKEPIRLWDAATGKEVRHYPKRSEFASQMAFAPGGKTMAVVHWGNYTPRFWDVASGREVVSADGPESEVTGIVFSRDSRTVTTAGHDDVIRQWETDTGRELRRWENVPRLLGCLASSPDGQTVAGGDAFGTICLWQANTGREQRRLKGSKGWVLGLAFAPDGKTLASAGNDGTVRLWDIATGTELRCFTGHERYARGVAFSPDGKTLATTAEDQTVRLWRVDTGEELRRLKTLHLQNHAVAISPDGRLLLVGSRGERPIQVWELATGRELPPFTLPRYQERIFSFGFSPDGRTLASGGEDGVVRLWEVTSGQERWRFTGHTGWAYRVLVAPDGKRLASASNDTTILVWDLSAAAGRILSSPLSAKELDALWADLSGGDATKAFRAIHRLAAAPEQSLRFLRQHLKPVPAPDLKRVRQLVDMLDSADFSTRQKAADELEKLGDAASSLLRQIVEKEKPSLEVRRRLLQILDAQENSPEALRVSRAVEVLECIATPDAVRLIDKLANGAADARLTREAVVARGRMRK